MRKTELVQLRCTEEEKAAWQQAARLAGLTLTQWIQLRCGEEARKKAPENKPPEEAPKKGPLRVF